MNDFGVFLGTTTGMAVSLLDTIPRVAWCTPVRIVLLFVFAVPPYWFFCSNASIAFARSLCKCFLAVRITASEADTVKAPYARSAIAV